MLLTNARVDRTNRGQIRPERWNAATVERVKRARLVDGFRSCWIVIEHRGSALRRSRGLEEGTDWSKRLLQAVRRASRRPRPRPRTDGPPPVRIGFALAHPKAAHTQPSETSLG